MSQKLFIFYLQSYDYKIPHSHIVKSHQLIL